LTRSPRRRGCARDFAQRDSPRSSGSIGIAGRTRRRTVGSHGSRGDRMGGWLADTDKPLGHYPSLWICRACGDFIWPLSSPSGSAARSDRGIALRIGAGPQPVHMRALTHPAALTRLSDRTSLPALGWLRPPLSPLAIL